MSNLIALLEGHHESDIRSHVLACMPALVNQKDQQNEKYWQEMKHVLFMYSMKAVGAWELSWDLWPDNDIIDLYPIKLTEVRLNDFLYMHQLLVSVGVFNSGKEAKRAGWSGKVVKGDYFFNKKTWVIRVK